MPGRVPTRNLGSALWDKVVTIQQLTLHVTLNADIGVQVLNKVRRKNNVWKDCMHSCSRRSEPSMFIQKPSGAAKTVQMEGWRCRQVKPSYNKSPQSQSPVLLSRRHFDKNAPADECVLASMRWGLVPAWFKENDPNKMHYSTSNCRSESMLSKKTYKDPMIKGQRCVILADGFYEWKKEGKDKQPFFIYFPQSQTASKEITKSQDSSDCEEKTEEEAPAKWTGWKLLTIAGLFDCWKPPSGGEPLYTYSVITVNASTNLQSIHNRMPAILEGEEEVRKWLDFGEVKSVDALELLQSKNTLTFHPVSSLVNNSRNNSPECLQPIDLKGKKRPKPTESSKMMTSWLKSSIPTKRKKSDTCEADEESSKTQRKSAGAPQQWLYAANKKPKTSM